MRRLAATAALFVGMAGAVLGAQERDALALYRAGRYLDAVDLTLEELSTDADNLDAYTVLGWSLNALGRYEEARRYGEEALQVSRFDNRLIEIVAEANFYLGNNPEALGYLQEYAAIAPTGDLIDEVYNFMGEVFLREESYHRADIALTAALFHNPDRAQWWARLGYAREMAGSHGSARRAYQEALARDRNLLEAQRGIERIDGT